MGTSTGHGEVELILSTPSITKNNNTITISIPEHIKPLGNAGATGKQYDRNIIVTLKTV